MSNRWRGTFDIEIGDEVFTLRPSFDAMVEFEDKTGVCANVAYRQIEENELSFKVVVGAIWAGIMGQHLAKGGDKPSYRVIGQKIRNAGVIDAAVHASKFLMYALIPEQALEEIEANGDKKKAVKKAAK